MLVKNLWNGVNHTMKLNANEIITTAHNTKLVSSLIVFKNVALKLQARILIKKENYQQAGWRLAQPLAVIKMKPFEMQIKM